MSIRLDCHTAAWLDPYSPELSQTDTIMRSAFLEGDRDTIRWLHV